MPQKKKAEFTEPTSLIDLRTRQENENQSSRAKNLQDGTHVEPDDGLARDFTGEDDHDQADAYTSAEVAPEYQGYANIGEAPFQSEDGPEKVAEEAYLESQRPLDYDEWAKANEGKPGVTPADETGPDAALDPPETPGSAGGTSPAATQ